MEKNEIEPVWFIEDNKVRKANKIVKKINYKGVEIPVLKTEMDGYSQEFLFKDKNNEYWSMRILGIKAIEFIKANNDPSLMESKEYCNKFMTYLKEFNLKEFFDGKIDRNKYFNLCELKYISKYYPDIYEKAKECREGIIEKNRQRYTTEKQEREEQYKSEVEKVNNNFNQRVQRIKSAIRLGSNIENEDLEFYKDNNYHNGKTVQNCFLFLAKQYGINIPLATQGFINNKLVRYDFTTGSYSYYRNKNSKSSTKIHEYMEKIQVCVREEFDKSVAHVKEEVEKILNNGRRR